MRRGVTLVLTAIVAVAVTAVVIVAPARAKDAVEGRIRRAAVATQREDTARIAVRIDVESDEASGSLTVDGVAALSGERGQLVVDLGDLVDTPASFEERIVDGILYLDFGSLLDAADVEPPTELLGKRWVRVDLSALTGLDATELQNLDPTGGATPTSQLDALRGIDDAVRVGTEDVDGIRTTHFRGTLRLATALERVDALPDEVRDGVEAAIEQLFRGDRALPVDLWLDAANRLRQMKTRIEVDHPEGGIVTVTMTIPEFGVPIDVAAPPADETIDFAEFQDLVGS